MVDRYPLPTSFSMELFGQQLGTTGTPFLILHGLFGLSDNWRTFGLKWQERYRMFLADARNHGRSPHTASHTYSEMAQDVADTLDAQGWADAILLGHSMGGKAVMQFALNNPRRVQALIVADMSPRAYPPHHDAILDALQAVKLDAISSRADADAAMAIHLDDVGIRQFLLKSLFRTEEGQFAWRFNLPVLAKDYAHILDSVTGQPFRGPTLFITGGQSRYVQDKDKPLIRELFPFHEHVVLPGAGHWLHAEQPDAFYTEVNQFLQRHGF